MISRIIFFVVSIVMCYASFFFYPRWKQPDTQAAISWDVSGYYWYLPSVFIFKDLKHQSFKDSILYKYRPTNTDFQQAIRCENGNYVMKYASGMAIMYFPFFIAAHILAGPLGYPADGFSAPYQFAIQFGGLLISIIGLWYFRKLLLSFYSDEVVAIVLVLLVLGSNYLNSATIDSGMSHCWLFTIYVFILLNTQYYYQSFKSRYALRIGLLIGLAVLTRPSDIVSCLIPILWGMESININSLKSRLVLIVQNYASVLLAVVCASGVIFIQLVYWKYASGHWLFYSYQNQNLYFRSPNFVNYTFSYRSGWLTYSPLLALAFLGIVPFVTGGKNKVAIITFFLINYYIVCCWNIWWYGGRAMIQSYPVLFFPVAELVKLSLNRKMQMSFLVAVAAIFIYYNIWIIYQSHNDGLFVIDSVKKAYFWRVVGRWKVPVNAVLLIDNPEWYEGKRENERIIIQDDFANDTGTIYLPHIAGNGKTLALDFSRQKSDIYKIPFSDNGVKWIRAQAVFHCDIKEWDEWHMAQFILRLVNKGRTIKENIVRVDRVLWNGSTKNISIDMKLPPGDYDAVNILFWNGGSEYPIYIDSLRAWSFNE